jgi:hypothetical protein
MYRPASMFVLRDRVLWSKVSDTHNEIAAGFELPGWIAGRLSAVPVEIVPLNGDYSRPLSEWKMKLDIEKHLLPEWWEQSDAVTRCSIALAEWAAHHILEQGVHSASGVFSLIVRGNAILNVTGQTGGYCRAYDNAILNVTGQTGGDCRAYDNAILNIIGQTGGDCRAYDNATLNIIGQTGGDCRAYGEATLSALEQAGGYCRAYDSTVLNVTRQTGGFCWAYDEATLGCGGPFSLKRAVSTPS